MWLDDCRIPYLNGLENEYSETYLKSGHGKVDGDLQKISGSKREGVYVDTKGRFTPNLLVCDDMLNDGSLTLSSGGIPNGKSVYGRSSYNESSTINTQTKVGFGDKGSNSRYYDLDLWFDKMLERL